MMILRTVCCILCIKYTVTGVHGQVLDQQCFGNCSCCKDEICADKYFSNTCLLGCIDGHRGARCYQLCQYENCKTCGDNSDSITCTKCYDGYYLGSNKDCTSQCPSNCKSCTSSAMCTECKEGFYDENGSTTCPYSYCPTNCECYTDQSDCISCKNGFYDMSTSCSKQCPYNCLTCESEASCYECKNGFYNGFEFDDNSNLQFYNCSYACRDTCTHCQSYNNCLQCMEGKYGQMCQENCPNNCAGGVCERTSGNCYDCIINFQGETCTECISGNYGPNCAETCPQYCANKTCDRITGVCIFGCMDGYSGDRCCLQNEHCLECTNNKVCRKCESGYFNNLCNEKCPEHCLGPCDIFTGECSICPYNRFGQFCEFDCSDRCKFEGRIHERACARSDGMCINGCNDGYFGRICNETCSSFCAGGVCRQDDGICINGCNDGYFGRICNETCSSFCAGGVCTQFDGVCINGCNGHQEEPECLFRKEQKGDDDATDTTSAILGCLLALTVVILIVENVFLFLKKRRKPVLRETRRQPPDATYENQLTSSVPDISQNNETNTVSASKTAVYEVINQAHDEGHEYQKISSMQPTSADHPPV